ncbi:MAG: hypothetical protein FJZ87_04385 [Chloroflexi bacterium]|nr:hypothetical protein [Chloroflexota bacterium]
MEWAMRRLASSGSSDAEENKPAKTQVENLRKRTSGGGESPARKKPRVRSALFPMLLIITGCAVLLFAAWSAMTSPVMASILNLSALPAVQPTQLPNFAQVYLSKPTNTPQSLALSQDAPPTQTSGLTIILPPTTEPPVVAFDPPAVPPTATQEPLLINPTDLQAPTLGSAAPETTETPGIALAEIIPDTPTSEYIAPTAAPYIPPQVASYDGAHWIDVDLSQQRVYAYAGDTLVNSFVVSTGTWQTPTVTGKYKVWIKLRYSDMSGPGYYLPDVPYVMYFYKGYGLHGTYWHNNFGTPMSHGCVNLTIPDAEWLYNFSSVGTVVNVHY